MTPIHRSVQWSILLRTSQGSKVSQLQLLHLEVDGHSFDQATALTEALPSVPRRLGLKRGVLPHAFHPQTHLITVDILEPFATLSACNIECKVFIDHYRVIIEPVNHHAVT